MDFTDFLTDLDHGRLHQQLGEQLEHVIDGVQTHGSAGSVTLKLTVTKEGDRAMVTPKLDVKVPHEPPAPTLFFFAREGGLTREDPRQLALRDLRPQAVREVDHG